MINYYVPSLGGTDSLHKKCDRTLSHKCVFISWYNNHNVISEIRLWVSRDLWAFWHFTPDEKPLAFYIGKNEHEVKKVGCSLALPLFEPDFSNYTKLIKKIKTYVTFS